MTLRIGGEETDVEEGRKRRQQAKVGVEDKVA